jgi:formate hydrogenlyase subunit 3/multisubunit Na+/H+ antiporter MnhD subunit
MSGFSSFLPLAAIIVSLIAFVLIILFNKKPNVRETVTIVAAIAKFGIVFSMLGNVLDGKYPGMKLISLSPGIELALRVDEAGLFLHCLLLCFGL